MWPFKKKEPERDTTGEAIEKLKAFRDIGETFNYLGRTCIVTGHCEYFPLTGRSALLHFDYCDNNGVLHSGWAGVDKLPGLINQQEPDLVEALGPLIALQAKHSRVCTEAPFGSPNDPGRDQ